MKGIIRFFAVFPVLLASVCLPITAASTQDAAPADAVQYAQDVVLEKVTGLIEASFTAAAPDTAHFRNAKQGDVYHLSAGKRFYALTGTVDLSTRAKPVIADLITPADGWFFTADNAAGVPVGLMEVSRRPDGSFGYEYGQDAFLFDKALRQMCSLLAAEGIRAEPLLLSLHTQALYARDADGTERLLPVPNTDREAEQIFAVTKLAQLPTGEDLYRLLQRRKREAGRSTEILYGDAVFQELMLQPDAAAAQTVDGFQPPWTVLPAACAAAAVAVAVFIHALRRKQKQRAASGQSVALQIGI